MGKKYLHSLLLALSVVLFIPAGGVHADGDKLQAIGIKNQQLPGANVISGGQPSKDQLAALKAAGVKHVINLRTPGEQSWDERRLVESMGMAYYAIPVAGAAGITQENASTLAALLESTNGEPTLLHCASGNRVGALIALSAATQGKSVDEAIAEGKRWGLTGLESTVRKKLNTAVELCCAEPEEKASGG